LPSIKLYDSMNSWNARSWCLNDNCCTVIELDQSSRAEKSNELMRWLFGFRWKQWNWSLQERHQFLCSRWKEPRMILLSTRKSSSRWKRKQNGVELVSIIHDYWAGEMERQWGAAPQLHPWLGQLARRVDVRVACGSGRKRIGRVAGDPPLRSTAFQVGRYSVRSRRLLRGLWT